MLCIYQTLGAHAHTQELPFSLLIFNMTLQVLAVTVKDINGMQMRNMTDCHHNQMAGSHIWKTTNYIAVLQ